MMKGMNQRRLKQFATVGHPEPDQALRQPMDDSGTDDAQ